MDDIQLPSGVVDEWRILSDGYAPWPPPDFGKTVAVGSTVSFIRSGESTIIHDPGLVRHRGVIIDPLNELGVETADVTDVVISHHHPDHTINIALFENARTHDVWGVYKGDQWELRWADGVDVAPGVRLVQTPGHSEQDVSVLTNTPDGLVVFTHLWWNAEVPEEDPYGSSQQALHDNRERILALNPVLIVRGHGPAFEPSSRPPRLSAIPRPGGHAWGRHRTTLSFRRPRRALRPRRLDVLATDSRHPGEKTCQVSTEPLS